MPIADDAECMSGHLIGDLRFNVANDTLADCLRTMRDSSNVLVPVQPGAADVSLAERAKKNGRGLATDTFDVLL